MKQIDLINRKRIWLLTILIVLVMPFVASQEVEESSFIYTQDEPADLQVVCLDINNTYCVASTNCTVTVSDSDQTILVQAQEMDFNPTYFNYTLNSTHTSAIGEYTVNAHCDGETIGFSIYNIEITPDGTLPTTAKSIMYTTLLVIIIILFLISTYFTFKLDGKNIHDVGGELIKVNIMKYIKFGLFFLSYMLFIFINYLCWLISDQYIGASSWFTMIFDRLHYFAWVFLFPIFFFGCLLTIIKAFLDMKIYELAKRGLPPR